MNILQMSFSAAVIIVAVVMIRALTLHRLPKRTFLALWGVVLSRLLIPFSVPSRFSFYTGLELVKRLLSAQTATSSPSPVLTTGSINIVDVPAAVEAVGGTPQVSSMTAAVSPLEIVWLIGLCICALFFITAYLRCRREFKTSLPVQNDFAECWLREHALRRTVQIRQSDRIQAPLTYGVFRPVILLPKAIDWTDEAGLKVILTHEMTHIRRFDTLIKLVLAAAVCVHWFNPFVWIMYALANRDIELSCDEAVVCSLGENMKSAYALTLIGLEEKKSALAPLISGFARNAIEERITAIMKIKRFTAPIIIIAVLLVAGVTVGFATSNAETGDEPDSVVDSKPAGGTSISTVGGVSGPVAVDSEPGKLVSVKLSDESKYTPEQWQDILTRIERGEITVEPESISNGDNTANNSWVWPVEGCDTVTSMFGKRVHPVSGTTTESDHITISGDNADGAKV